MNVGPPIFILDPNRLTKDGVAVWDSLLAEVPSAADKQGRLPATSIHHVLYCPSYRVAKIVAAPFFNVVGRALV